MLYNQPLDQPTNPNASYVDGNPAAGIEGSIVPAASLELDQREVVEVIFRAYTRGYFDFSGTPCGAPSNADLQQLRKAIEGFITNVEYFIDTDVTFTVHGPGAQFTDLNAAMEHLSKYKILRNGSVTLQCGGSLGGTAQQFIYTESLLLEHPNSEKITVKGAPLIGAPPNDTNFAPAGGGYSQANANADLAMLRGVFGTELHFTGGTSVSVYENFTIIDLLITGDASGSAVGLLFTGGLPIMRDSAVHGFSSVGIMINQAYLVTTGNWVSSSGNVGDGFEVQGELYFPSPTISASNQGNGYSIQTGTSLKGGVKTTAKGNAGVGFSVFNAQVTTYLQAYNNGSHGLSTYGSPIYLTGGHCSGNVSGLDIVANYGANIVAVGVTLAAATSPPLNTIGNGNALITH
jgi:hypothetical protein